MEGIKESYIRLDNAEKLRESAVRPCICVRLLPDGSGQSRGMPLWGKQMEQEKGMPDLNPFPEVLDAREENFRVLTAAAFEGIGISDKGRVLVVNDQLAKLFGYTPEELIGMDVLLMAAPQSRVDAAEAVRSGREGPYELYCLRKDGTVFDAEVRAKMVRWQGRPVRLTAVRDITERKESERRIKSSEELLRAIIEDQSEMIVRATPEGIRTFVNRAYCRFFQRSFSQMVGKSFYPAIPEEDRESVRLKIQSLTPDSPIATDIHRAIRPDGEISWQEWSDRGLFDEKSRLVGIQSVGRDITKRKLAEEELLRTMAFDEVLTQVLARFATAGAPDLDEAIVAGLEAIARFFGADQAFVLIVAADGKTWSATHEWCGPSVRSTFHQYQKIPFGAFPWGEKKILAGEIMRIDEMSDFPPEAAPDRRHNEADGVVSVLSVPIRGVTGRVTGSVGLRSHAARVKWSEKGTARLQIVGNAIASILERKRAEESLREVSNRLHRAHEEERRRIARELHDSTAQELAAVKMNLEMLEDFQGNITDSAVKLLKESVGLVDQCAQEVRTFSYLLHPPLLDQMGLEAALRSYLDGFAKRSGLDVVIQIAPGIPRQPPEVELTLFRVVQEAVGNVRRHSESRKATIRLNAKDDKVILEIIDSGKGVPRRILEDFARGTACDGVGLPAMKERLHEIGGTLTIENINPGVRVRAEAPLTA